MLIQLCPPFLSTFPKAEGEMFKQQLSDKAGGLSMGGITEARALDFLNQGGGGRGQGWRPAWRWAGKDPLLHLPLSQGLGPPW